MRKVPEPGGVLFAHRTMPARSRLRWLAALLAVRASTGLGGAIAARKGDHSVAG